jgi:hypothetical protein
MKPRVAWRGVVLTLLLIAFAGPWGWTPGSDEPTRLVYLPEFVLGVRDLLTTAFGPAGVLAAILAVILAAILAVPVTCLLAILAPSSRPRVVAYRVLAWAMASLFLFALLWLGLPLELSLQVWGAGLYFAALVLAAAVELVPPRRSREPRYADVFE